MAAPTANQSLRFNSKNLSSAHCLDFNRPTLSIIVWFPDKVFTFNLMANFDSK